MKDLIELALKRVEDLEKKLEKYYSILSVGNEIDFILKGTHILQEDIDNVISGELREEMVNSIETLKQELIAQKNLIENKGGFVSVANNYPSPSEITEGIKTVTGSDFSMTTATEADVLLGKTFFSGNSQLKTGTATFDANSIHHIFMAPENVQTTEDIVYYTFPAGTTKIRKYCFYKNINPIHIVFHEDITAIEEYSFYSTKNMIFENFENLRNLKSISSYAFSNSSVKGIDFANFPSNLSSIASYAFYNAYNETLSDFKFPDNLASVGNAAFRQDKRVSLNNLDLSNYPLSALADYCFQKIAFNCDFTLPPKITEVGDYFNHGGCFKNIIIPAGVTLRPYCFGASSSDSVSLYYLETVTFEAETPGVIGTNVFALQNRENNFKIYVPDNSIEAYKALSNMSPYVNYIYPMSEKE